jgi:hypothetical protein
MLRTHFLRQDKLESLSHTTLGVANFFPDKHELFLQAIFKLFFMIFVQLLYV